MQDVLRTFEGLIRSSIEAVKATLGDELEFHERKLSVPETPFKVSKRRELEEKYGKGWEAVLSRASTQPVWVTDIPREFYDFEDEASGGWRNFDLIMPEGYGEVISGAEREYEYGKMLRKLERDGLKHPDATYPACSRPNT